MEWIKLEVQRGYVVSILSCQSQNATAFTPLVEGYILTNPTSSICLWIYPFSISSNPTFCLAPHLLQVHLRKIATVLMKSCWLPMRSRGTSKKQLHLLNTAFLDWFSYRTPQTKQVLLGMSSETLEIHFSRPSKGNFWISHDTKFDWNFKGHSQMSIHTN